MAPRVLKLTLAYEGTHYVGWQRQAAGTSVQGVVEAALQRVLGIATATPCAHRGHASAW